MPHFRVAHVGVGGQAHRGAVRLEQAPGVRRHEAIEVRRVREEHRVAVAPLPAYESGAGYLRAGIRFLPDEAWDSVVELLTFGDFYRPDHRLIYRHMGKLAEAVGGLVHQMREEQRIMRQWAQEQSEQTANISRTLNELSDDKGKK